MAILGKVDEAPPATPAGELLHRVRNHAMPRGTPSLRGSWLCQKGSLRLAPDRPWMSFEAEQTFHAERIDFEWNARFRLLGIIPLEVRDAFQEGRGVLSLRLFGFLPHSRTEGEAVDRGEVFRALAELPWRPAFFEDRPEFEWSSPRTGVLRVAYSSGFVRAAVDLDVDREGRITGGKAVGRPRIVGKGSIDTDWVFRFEEYREMEGIVVPTRGEVSWLLPEGLFTYWRGEVTAFRARA